MSPSTGLALAGNEALFGVVSIYESDDRLRMLHDMSP